jgi:crotonobetainyl-CoA:carnitine CoA-transferase CaiB-like acyl-CoA transferase
VGIGEKFVQPAIRVAEAFDEDRARAGGHREIAKRLVAVSDIVAEGFSPGVLDRLGLGYDVQRKMRPDIIYV